MATAFSDLQIKVASEESVFGLQKHLASIKYFAHDFSPAEEKPFAGVQIPVYDLAEAAEFNEDSNNWGSGTNEISACVATLDKHFIKTLAISDVDAGSTDVNFLRDGAKAITEVISHAANKYVYGLINDTNVTLTADMPATKAAFAGLMKVCDDNGVNPYECVLALNAENFGALLATLDYAVIGTSEAVKYGVIENLYGFRAVVMTSYLPAGTKGAIIPYNTMGVVSRLNKPMVDGYVATWTAKNDDGFALGFRVYEDLAKGKAFLGADVLLGAKLLQPGIVRLV